MYENRNKLWADIDYDTWLRLAECRSVRKDVPVLAKSVYHNNDKNFNTVDALVYVFEHLDSNNQYYLTDVDDDQFDEWVKEIAV
jgi:hypothetical protein